MFLKLPPGSHETLLGFHAITGCDTTSYFAGHSKKSAWKTFLDFWQLLRGLGKGLSLTTDVKTHAETFICRMYNIHHVDSTDEGRYIMFPRASKPEVLCPTQNAVQLHIKRAHYQALIWQQADQTQPGLPNPTDFGWEERDGKLVPILMTTEPIPDACAQMVYCMCKTQCRYGRCKCKKSSLKCTRMCTCTQNGSCLNSF